MIKKYSHSYIGKEYTTNEGYKAVIIDGGNKAGYATIKINTWESQVRIQNLISGNIKYPYHHSVFGVGYIGEGKYTKKDYTKLYSLWQSMLMRGYDIKYHTKQPTYKDVTVCEEWHSFQVFGVWFEANYIEGWELDKDLLMPGNKVYSPETTLFVPRTLNMFLSTNYSTNTSGCAGVELRSDNKWQASISIDGTRKYLGRFVEKSEAIKVYKLARIERVKYLRNAYKNILPIEALEAIR